MKNNKLSNIVLLGAWISLIVTFILHAYTIWLLIPVFGDEIWSALTNPASASYHPNFKLLFSYQMTMHIILVLAVPYILHLWIKKRSNVPRLVIYYYLFSLIFVVIAYLLLRQIDFMEEIAAEYAAKILRQGVLGLIWIPYFWFSSHVRKIFCT